MDRGESTVEIFRAPNFDRLQLDAEGVGGRLELSPIRQFCRIGCVPQNRDTRYAGHDSLEQVELLRAEFGVHLRETGDVAAGMRQALDITRSDWIAVNDEHDRDVSGHFLSRCRFGRRESDDQVYFKVDELEGR